ncbi:DNA-directed RNA polymerase I subunit rpa49 [Polyrhizophydium stewartii]|uniref:DNA-directed RNA polymerase I subunit rpa49 n=1 Tax=Polyrhizophydium stewartii TaxID=2732419 RepID=A0ABR4NCU2_9FUNG
MSAPKQAFRLVAAPGSAGRDGASTDALFLASFPVVPPALDSIEFGVFNRPTPPNADAATKAMSRKRRLVVGETPKMEYVGETEAANCKYIVGVLDKATGVVTLREADTLSMTPIVKAQKLNHQSRTIAEKPFLLLNAVHLTLTPVHASQNMTARNQLGEAFGTKKRKQAIRALEKNQVDVSGLQAVAHKISEKIEETSALLPAKAEIDSKMLAERDIPPCNTEATTPEEVYRIADIVPAEVLDSIDIKQLWKSRLESDIAKAMQSLKATDWVLGRIVATVQEQSDKKRAKLLVYLAMLARFYSLKQHELNKDISQALGGSQTVAEHVAFMFSEWQEDGNGKRRLRVSNKLKDKLLAYIVALCLHLNNFSVNLNQIASDLSLPMTKVVSVAREMGCRVETYKSSDGGQFGEKRAVLALPLVFSQRRR